MLSIHKQFWKLPLEHKNHTTNRPRSIYQYSSTAPRLSGQNCKFFQFHLSFNSQKRLGYKGNNTKYRILTRKPRSHVRILIYRTWPILMLKISMKTLSKQARTFLRTPYMSNWPVKSQNRVNTCKQY